MSPLGDTLPQVLLASVGVELALVVRAALGLERRNAELGNARRGLRDPSTGLLTPVGFEQVAGAELAWAQRDGIATSLLVVRLHALDWRAGVERMRSCMRGHEHAGLVGVREIAILLWDATADGAALAAARLGDAARFEHVRSMDLGWTEHQGADDTIRDMLGRARSMATAPQWPPTARETAMP